MKPEEKAEELMAIYGTTLVTFNEDSEEWEDCSQHAKQCTLICVDEILKDLIESFKISREMHPHAQGLIAGSLSFWQEVKSIIQEL